MSEPADTQAKLSAATLVRLLQGFYSIFWGLILTAVAAAHLLAGSVLAPTRTSGFDIGLLAFGLAAVLIGSWRLWRVRLSGNDAWRVRTETLLGAAAALAYFAVFFCAWRHVPWNEYLLANALAFLGAGVVYTVLLNCSVNALAAAIGRRDLAVESKWYNAGSVAFLLLPLIGALVYAFGAAAAKHTGVISEIIWLADQTNIVVVGILLLPFSLTLSLVWAAKDVLLGLLSATNASAD